MKASLLLPPLLLALALVPGCATLSAKGDDIALSARQQEGSGDWSRANETRERAAALAFDSAAAQGDNQRQMAINLMEQGRNDEALALFKKVGDRKGVAHALVAKKDYAGAIKELDTMMLGLMVAPANEAAGPYANGYRVETYDWLTTVIAAGKGKPDRLMKGYATDRYDPSETKWEFIPAEKGQIKLEYLLVQDRLFQLALARRKEGKPVHYPAVFSDLMDANPYRPAKLGSAVKYGALRLWDESVPVEARVKLLNATLGQFDLFGEFRDANPHIDAHEKAKKEPSGDGKSFTIVGQADTGYRGKTQGAKAKRSASQKDAAGDKWRETYKYQVDESEILEEAERKFQQEFVIEPGIQFLLDQIKVAYTPVR